MTLYLGNTPIAGGSTADNMVTTDTAQTISGLKNFSNDGQSSDNAQIEITTGNIDASSAPTSSKYAGIVFKDVNGHRNGKLEIAQLSDGTLKTVLDATNLDGTHGQIAVGVTPNGTVYTIAPTPASSDNSTKIATTAFVKSVLSSSGNGLATISKSGNGYCKFTNGLLIQWGNVSVAKDSKATVTFPTAFSDTNYRITATVGNAIQTGGGGLISTTTHTATNFVMSNGQDATYGINWIAIGY